MAERVGVRLEVGIQQLVAGQVEADDSGAGVPRAAARATARLMSRSSVTQRRDDGAAGHAGRGRALAHPLGDWPR